MTFDSSFASDAQRALLALRQSPSATL